MIHFLVHDKQDSVGVATVDIKKADKVRGRYMDTQENIDMQAVSDVPLGHKIALKAHSSKDSVIKYGHDIGKVVENIKLGEHVHIHNLKTKRW
ncbi:MAG: UxaA family hydrolase [Planctomycetota bacterium]|jgi:(2R)-sulfolactate sulfo-lyase subunit alpha